MFCSPAAKTTNYKEYKTCFSKEALVKLATAWNESVKTEDSFAKGKQPITGIAKASIKKLWSALKERMESQCSSKGPSSADHSLQESCWVDKLSPNVNDVAKVNKLLSPKMPKEWKKNPITWLTNLDIDAVLKQYDEAVDNHYKYMGAFPIDFAKTTGAFGQCLYNEMCTIDIKKLVASGKNMLGVIFNTDTSDGPGQHWISLIAVINPKLKAYGVYFQDSAASTPPPEVIKFMESLKAQAEPHFSMDTHKKRMQYKNTECGVYSIAYQIRWINLLKNDPNVKFEDIALVISDEAIQKARGLLFRPRF